MNSDSPSFEGCEAVQWAISEAMDQGDCIPKEAESHIASCPECARFAQTWLAEDHSVSELKRPLLSAIDPHLRQRVMAQIPEQNPAIATFPATSPVGRSMHWKTWAKIAASFAVAGLFWYVLASPNRQKVSPAPIAHAPKHEAALPPQEPSTAPEPIAIASIQTIPLQAIVTRITTTEDPLTRQQKSLDRAFRQVQGEVSALLARVQLGSDD